MQTHIERRRIVRPAAVGIVLIVGVVGLAMFRTMKPARPMFHNELDGLGERYFLPQWIECLPVFDRSRNVLYAEYENNILVILCGPSEAMRKTRPIDDSGAYLQLATEDDAIFKSNYNQYVVGRDNANSIIVFMCSGDNEEWSISEGVAESAFEALSYEISRSGRPEDLRVLLREWVGYEPNKLDTIAEAR